MDTVEYWLNHIDQFDVLFSPPLKQPPVPVADGQPFGQTAIVVRALNVYYGAVEAFFDSLPAHPVPHRLAADALLAAVHGIIQFPRMTRTMQWSDIASMAEVVIDGMLDHWTAQASGKRTVARK
jgi:hypothetical protein